MKLLETYESLINDEKFSELNAIIKEKYPKYYSPELMNDLFNWINSSGVKSIKFENIGAMGMAHYDKLILNKILLFNNFSIFLYVILHETSHYYQIKKHGLEFITDIFKGDELKSMVDELLRVENAADRLAIRKFKDIDGKYNLNLNAPKISYNDMMNNEKSYNGFLSYVESISKEVKEKNIKTANGIADIIYNSIKSVYGK
jgi:hypothetical protein